MVVVGIKKLLVGVVMVGMVVLVVSAVGAVNVYLLVCGE